jgi:hypothetical protein
VAIACALAATSTGRADPLPKDACDAVGAEHAKLSEAGLPDLVKKGPEWVKANLGEARLKDVARYISLHEDLLFKCGYDKLKSRPGADADETSDKPDGDEPPPPLPQRKPPVPEAFKTRAVPAAASTSEAGEAAKRPKPTSRRKIKVDDAYRPPTKEWAPQ